MGDIGGAGFDATHDIAGITVNRWPQGDGYDTLGKRALRECPISRGLI